MRGGVASLSACRAERRLRDVAVDSHCIGQVAAKAYLAYQRAVARGADPGDLDRLLATVEAHTEVYRRLASALHIK